MTKKNLRKGKLVVINPDDRIASVMRSTQLLDRDVKLKAKLETRYWDTRLANDNHGGGSVVSDVTKSYNDIMHCELPL